MGDASDHMEDVETGQYFFNIMERDIQYYYLQAKIGDITWTQKNGKMIKVEDMEMPHLRNVVALVERRKHPKAHLFRLFFVAKYPDEYLPQPPKEADVAVHNKHHGTAPSGAVYIGRGSPWGNPYVIGKDGTRDDVCDLFEKNILPTLDVSKLAGKHLICFCAPHRCHGDAILKKANNTEAD